MKKKIIDVSKPVSKKAAPAALSEDFKKFDKKIGKKLEKKIEEFEKKEEEKFNKEKKPERKIRKFPRATYILSVLILFLLAGAVYAGVEFLPKATIKIITKKTEWAYNDSVIADKKGEQLPVEIFSTRKNFNFSFQALGRKQAEIKASGKIIVYNAFSSGPQPLVAGTRFETPDKKIFRLTERIIVPGAQVIDGKIKPSGIEATVMADQAGPQYNIGPIGRFSIPGFSGAPKEKGFYAESKEPMKGGFIGEAAYPTEDDIKKAKEKARKELKDYIDSYFSLQVPQEFKFIEGGRQFSILKEEVNAETDEKGNFTVFAEGELKAIGFKESDLLSLMEGKAQSALGEKFRIKSYQMEYGVGRPDFQKGQISFALNFKGVFEEPLDIENFKQKILGGNEKELRNLISSYSNIQKPVVFSFWPFWVKRVPENLKRVIVEVE
jgi:hypothetical protein